MLKRISVALVAALTASPTLAEGTTKSLVAACTVARAFGEPLRCVGPITQTTEGNRAVLLFPVQNVHGTLLTIAFKGGRDIPTTLTDYRLLIDKVIVAAGTKSESFTATGLCRKVFSYDGRVAYGTVCNAATKDTTFDFTLGPAREVR